MTIHSFNTSAKSQSSFSKNLIDAYEQREYAEYLWITDKVKKYWEVPPVMCRLIPAFGNEHLCKSEDEYDAFVASYME
jgi:hypothetical protein